MIAACARFCDDLYALQLIDETELQFAALEEHAESLGRMWVLLSAVALT